MLHSELGVCMGGSLEERMGANPLCKVQGNECFRLMNSNCKISEAKKK